MALQCQTSQPRAWVQMPTCLDSQAADGGKERPARDLAVCVERGSGSIVPQPDLLDRAQSTQLPMAHSSEGVWRSSASALPRSLIKNVDVGLVFTLNRTKRLGVVRIFMSDRFPGECSVYQSKRTTVLEPSLSCGRWD